MANAFRFEKDLYAAGQPFNGGVLDRGLHKIHFEECGDPHGRPVVFVHGGPGAATMPAHRRLFNPQVYRAVLFDQRGCGRSTPHGEIAQNNTDALVADMEALRAHLGIDSWILFGGSWGSTLALAYAIAHPERVEGLVIRGIFLGTKREVDWFLYEMGRFFPSQHEKFVSILNEEERADILTSYHRRLMDPKPAIHLAAAERWASYETSCSTLSAGDRHVAGRQALAMARLEAHYFMNDCFMPPDHIMRNVPAIRHLPAYIIQGRHDVICPPYTAHGLAQAWGAKAELCVVEDAGHSTFESGITRALLDALEAITPI